MKKSDVRARKITKGFTYPLPDSSSETERLIQQSAFINPFTRALFMEAGIAPSMSVLDVGSGAGDVALLAADLVGSEGRVVGVDRNGAGFGVARARAKGNVGLRPTRTRVALACTLFGQGNRHVTAEMLFEEATRAKVPVALATVYNTLHEFTKVGFLRQVAIDSSKSYFDTNNTEHHHYYLEDRHELMDIPPTDVAVGEIPAPPAGHEIARVDVVVRLRRKEPAPR